MLLCVYRKQLLAYVHVIIILVYYAGGHLGRDKTHHKIAERFYWKLLWKDVKEYVRTCEMPSL